MALSTNLYNYLDFLTNTIPYGPEKNALFALTFVQVGSICKRITHMQGTKVV
jgi:hypothetical protein